MKVYAKDYKKIYDPSIGEAEKWYINDHTIIKGADGYHLFGITHEEPMNPSMEKFCAHAKGEKLTEGMWEKLPFPIKTEAAFGEAHFWAPHVIFNGGLYYMYWCAGSLVGNDKYRIHLATSKDLYTWERAKENPMVIDGYDARDPMVIKIGEKWVMYYTATEEAKGGHHVVKAVTSDDLIHWENPVVVFKDPSVGTWGGPCESPFVIEKGGKYFLFIGPRHEYCETGVFISDDPFSFSIENQVGTLPSHAAEVIFDDEKYYVTNCGWGQGGVYIAELIFEE